MRTPGSLKIGTFRGVDLNVHVTLLFLLFYIVMVASAQLPWVIQASGINPDLIGGSSAAWGILFAFGIFGSVALHEFGHAFTAQSMGVEVKGITLMMLGGVSEMGRVPDQRLSEFKLAIMGPLVSFALAGLMFLTRSWVNIPEIEFFAYWLGSANLVLAVFNLLPVFPMDGGRALRSLLTHRQGKLKATRTAVSVSKAFALFFGIWGILSFNIILILIAFFVYTGGKTELLMLESQELLQGIRAEDMMFRIEPVQETQVVRVAAERMFKSRIGMIPVETLNGGAAILRLDDLRKVPQDRWGIMRVRDIHHKAPRVLEAHESVQDAFLLLAESRLGALPVQKDGRLVGLIRSNELTEVLRIRSVQGRSPHSGEDSDSDQSWKNDRAA